MYLYISDIVSKKQLSVSILLISFDDAGSSDTSLRLSKIYGHKYDMKYINAVLFILYYGVVLMHFVITFLEVNGMRNDDRQHASRKNTKQL